MHSFRHSAARRSLAAACAVGVTIVAAIAVTARGQEPAPEGTVVLVPNTAGAPSKLKLQAEGQQGQSGQAPRSAVLSIARGFRFERRARAERCTKEQAEDFSCPSRSKIGAGDAEVTASGAFFGGGSRDFVADIQLFLAEAEMRGDVADIIVQARERSSGFGGTARGRLVKLESGQFGHELRFEQFPGSGQSFPGVTVTVKRVRLTVGARRTVKRVRVLSRRRVRTRRGTRIITRRQVTTRRFNLITNPATCAGSWPYQLRVTYPDREVVRDGAVACSSG